MNRLTFVAFLSITPLMAGCTPAASDNDPVPNGDPGSGATATSAPVATPAVGSSDTATRMQAEADANDACGASKVEPWIGKEATVPVRIEVAQAAGAGTDRWIYPDSVVTQDFRPDRLNVIMEQGTDKILSARCG